MSSFSWPAFFNSLFKEDLKSFLKHAEYFEDQRAREALLANFLKVHNIPAVKKPFEAVKVLKSFCACRRFDSIPNSRYLTHLYANVRGIDL